MTAAAACHTLIGAAGGGEMTVVRQELGWGTVTVVATRAGEVMAVVTFEAVVENGQVRLPPGVVLPERPAVFVVVPAAAPPAAKLPGVRLADSADAAKFEMTVTWGDDR